MPRQVMEAPSAPILWVFSLSCISHLGVWYVLYPYLYSSLARLLG